MKATRFNETYTYSYIRHVYSVYSYTSRLYDYLRECDLFSIINFKIMQSRNNKQAIYY